MINQDLIKLYDYDYLYLDKNKTSSTSIKTINHKEKTYKDNINLCNILQQDYKKIDFIDYNFITELLQEHDTGFLKIIIKYDVVGLFIYDNENKLLKEKTFNLKTDINRHYSIKINLEYLNSIMDIFKHSDKVNLWVYDEFPLLITDLNKLGIISPIIEKD